MIITAANLGKQFNREWIFKDLSYSFKPGIHAVTGPNGSGKSTLLQVLWGQLPASEGTLTFTEDEKDFPAEDIYQQIVIATPYMDLVEEFTLEEILKFHFSFKKSINGKSIHEIMDLLELSHAKNKTIGQFSSGMKQRLKLGLAFFSDVKIVFLDEPTTNLDKKSIAWYWQNFEHLGPEKVVFVGSNLENEYPQNAVKINLPDYK
ncbi:MAG: ABC transporter ATP-binding protein [Cyclobacteriaceae bacterium]|nr:ABC transporter ATP-binding protein [Cyclobacteriaceae bacterium]